MNEDLKSIPYIVFEAAEARSERHIKRLIVALIISILISFLANVAWLYTYLQYDYETHEESVEILQDGYGLNIAGDSNEVNNGSEN